ncbi:hypothetical protein M405DRAFT_877312 [Rhizopogon salebrosus TDB-379]|nr:hypothetical protein M405DRAFT_877312 [Rhizopogon salebrosus TDB-379]
MTTCGTPWRCKYNNWAKSLGLSSRAWFPRAVRNHYIIERHLCDWQAPPRHPSSSQSQQKNSILEPVIKLVVETFGSEDYVPHGRMKSAAQAAQAMYFFLYLQRSNSQSLTPRIQATLIFILGNRILNAAAKPRQQLLCPNQKLTSAEYACFERPGVTLAGDALQQLRILMVCDRRSQCPGSNSPWVDDRM